jgi:putative holliday junction resolvase
MLDMLELVDLKNSTSPFTILAFDFGTQRIGIAVGQSVTKSAAPLAVLTVKSRLERIAAITPFVEQWEPKLLIVGQPFFADGTAHDITALSSKFARQMSEHFRLPFILVDERYTSVEAERKIQSDHLSISKKIRQSNKSRVDAWAAALIAEQYFNQLDHA